VNSVRGRGGRVQRGQILVLTALALPVLLVFVGLAIDGSRLFQAQLDAQNLADRAADAGAQEIDIAGGATARTGTRAELVQGRGRGSAFATAAEVLAGRVADRERATRWPIDVGRRAISVVVERDVELAFMPIGGFRTQTVVARSVSGPLNGISAPTP
jgi:uncharacterized membrane protein